MHRKWNAYIIDVKYYNCSIYILKTIIPAILACILFLNCVNTDAFIVR